MAKRMVMLAAAGALALSAPAPAEILITEVLPGINTTDTAGDTVELHNTGPGAVDLAGWVLTDLDPGTSELDPLSEGTFLPGGLGAPPLQAGQFAVVVFTLDTGTASATATNYGLLITRPVVTAGSSYFDVGNEQALLVDPMGVVQDSVCWADTASVPGTPSDVQDDMAALTTPTMPGGYTFTVAAGGAWDGPDAVPDMATYNASAVDFTGLTNVSTYGGGALQRISAGEVFSTGSPDGTTQWQAMDRTEATLGDYSAPVPTGMGIRPIREAGSIAERIAALRSTFHPDRRIVVDEDTNVFQEPGVGEMASFRTLFQTCLAGQWEQAFAQADVLDYQVVEYFDIPTARAFHILQEKVEPGDVGFRGWGTFVFDDNPDADGDLVVEVPHPIHDSRTPDQAGMIAQQVRPRVTLVAGAHRNNNTTDTPCDGTQTGGQPYNISDVAHATNNWFHAAHEELEAGIAGVRFLQLHGFCTCNHPGLAEDVVVSNGFEAPPAANSFAELLRARINAQNFTCDAGVDDDLTTAALFGDEGDELGGTNNVQARLTNGVAAGQVCNTEALGSSERFVHLEQDEDVREEPQHIIDALIEALALLDAASSVADWHEQQW